MEHFNLTEKIPRSVGEKRLFCENSLEKEKLDTASNVRGVAD